MSSDAAMETELASVLADPTFVRSPVLARLLAYLVGMTVTGQSQGLKSYSVAVDGLGRSPDLDPQVDTYARVQVARLRKALDGYYSSRGAASGQRLTIGSGSYEVRLAPNAATGPMRLGELSSKPFVGRRVALIAAGLIVLFAIAVAWAIHGRMEAQAAAERWKLLNFPSVVVTVIDHTDDPAKRRYAEMIRQDLLMRISKYPGIRVYYDNTANATYSISVHLYPSGSDLLANTFVVDRKDDRLAWSASDIVDIDPGDLSTDRNGYISRTSFTIAEASGVVHSSERRRRYTADTPYGCWLRFTAQLPNGHVINDPELIECAAAWHAAVPDSPGASGVYAWTLLDRSILAVLDRQHDEYIKEAIDTLDGARALNPTVGFLPAVAVRAHALAGDDPAMRAAAAQALRLNPGNIEIEGLVGMTLTLRNDPQGRAILDDAIARHPNAPPRYFIAKFVSAMMRDDVAEAGQALGEIRQLNHTLPVVPVLAAAYEAKTGNLAAARKSWEQAEQRLPALRIDPDLLFKRTLLGPDVAARLKLWLEPIGI